MKNKYIINFSRKFLFWFWEKLMDGFAPSDTHGNYKRPKGILIDKISSYENYKEQIFLLVGNSCPWCHRTLLIHRLKNLSKQVKVFCLEADINSGQWVFIEKFRGCKTLNQFYKKGKQHNIFRPTLPLLFNFQNDQINILSNESSQIIKILNSVKSESKYQALNIKNCNQKFLDLIHNSINDGVYRCGFARNQSAYEKASKNLFAALNEVENSLKRNKGEWIYGEELTYADIYLFPTLIRWELIYSKLFKCTEQELSSFEKIIEWRLNFFKLSNVKRTCFDNEWKKDYYKALFPLNPNQLIPILPSLKEIMRLES